MLGRARSLGFLKSRARSHLVMHTIELLSALRINHELVQLRIRSRDIMTRSTKLPEDRKWHERKFILADWKREGCGAFQGASGFAAFIDPMRRRTCVWTCISTGQAA